MNETLKDLLLALSIFAFLFILMISAIRFSSEIGDVREFHEKFALIQLGDTEDRVLSILGSPNSVERKFRIGQREGFEEAYARADASDSTYYLLWYRGIDVVFTVGINDKGQVSAKESGGT